MTEDISEKELLAIIQAGEVSAAAFSSSYTAKLAQALLDARAEIKRLTRERSSIYAGITLRLGPIAAEDIFDQAAKDCAALQPAAEGEE